MGKIDNISITINQRFSIITTLTSSLLSFFVLNFKIGKHKKFTLISMSIVLVLYFGMEITFNTEYDKFFKVFFMNILNLILITFMDVTERYLGDYDFTNPFGILAGEGFVIFILTAFYSIGKNPFGQLKQLYEEFETGKYILLIFLLFLYMLLSAGINIYKIHCNVFFSPIARTLTDYLFNPIYLIYSFFFENDFMYKGEQSIAYFIVSEFMSFIITFLGFVYNEYIILFCFDLESDTNYGIDRRSITLSESNDDDDDSDDDNEDNNENKEEIEN